MGQNAYKDILLGKRLDKVFKGKRNCPGIDKMTLESKLNTFAKKFDLLNKAE